SPRHPGFAVAHSPGRPVSLDANHLHQSATLGRRTLLPEIHLSRQSRANGTCNAWTGQKFCSRATCKWFATARNPSRALLSCQVEIRRRTTHLGALRAAPRGRSASCSGLPVSRTEVGSVTLRGAAGSKNRTAA